MSNYSYGTVKDTKGVKLEIVDLIGKVQKVLKNEFTFRHDFAGASKYTMIPSEFGNHIGFEFDVDILLQGEVGHLQPKEIKHKLMDAFSYILRDLNAGTCSNYTNGFTVYLKDERVDKLLHSCNFVILKSQEGSLYSINQDKDKKLCWVEVSKEIEKLPLKEEWLKNNLYWQEVRDLYLEKKNNYKNKRKDSRTLYLETIQEICEEFRYID